jgi:beta-lactamase superfamily II metal-dependent hydrolase
MNCEIEFLPVGSESKAGDAIVVRYGDVASYDLMIIDGGDLETGEAAVSHVRRQFGQGSTITHVVLTHADADHASGLRQILRELPVANLWLHVPWLSAPASRPYFADKRWTDAGLEAAIKGEYDIVAEILDIAVEKGISIRQPFAGDMVGPFQVLSPTIAAYSVLLPQFDRTPDPDQSALEGIGCWIGKSARPGTLAAIFQKAVAVARKWIPETWYQERLIDGGVTTASNESSLVLYGDFPDRRILLTGDAGIQGLSIAAQSADSLGLRLQDFTFVQVPHHGSRRNVGPSILNRLLGSVRPQGESTFTAFVSAPKDDEKHPRQIVLNAFRRRGARVLLTQGRSVVYYGGFQPRPGYVNLDATPFSEVVEDYD